MRKLFWIITIFPVFQAGACKCAQVDISHHIERVFDVVVGKVISEKEEDFECNSPFYNSNSFKYLLRIDYSYRKKLSGNVELFGGKGRGDCGAILDVGKNYQIAVFKCADKYYTSMCADNNFLPDAGWTLKWLNNYFSVDYQPVTIAFIISSALIALTVLMSLSLLSTCNFYRYRSLRFTPRSIVPKLRHATTSTRPWINS